MRIGVVAVQGGYRPHLAAIEEIGHAPIEVRTQQELERCEGLILVGGESTTQTKLLESAGLDVGVRRFAKERPTLATCAGLVLMAKWRLIDVEVERNGYGSQVHSFEACSDGSHPLVFIRAPRIRAVGDGVEVIDRLRGEAITVRVGPIVAASHHPELTPDRWLHRLAF